MMQNVLGAWDDAIRDLDEAIRLGPPHALHLAARGEARMGKGDWAGALADFDSALSKDPDHIRTLESRSVIHSACPNAKYRDARKAHDDAKRLCELTDWKQPRALTRLANAHAEAGRFDEAEKYQQLALDRAELGQWRYCREVLELYKQKQPYRLPEK